MAWLARLDAPRLAGLVGAALVVALASTARPDEPAVPQPVAPASVATRFTAPAPVPVDTRPTAPAPGELTEAAPASVDARPNAPAPGQLTEAAPAFVDAHLSAPRSPTPEATATWTDLTPLRTPAVRGRQLAFADLAPDGERLTGRRIDGSFAPRGATILVHFASWCLPCADELPEVFALARALSDISRIETSSSEPHPKRISKTKTSPARTRPSPTLAFVSHDEAAGPQALLASFEDLLAKARFTAADVPTGLSLRADPEGRFFTALKRSHASIADPTALPSLWLLDRRGRLVAHLAGPLTPELRARLLNAVEALR